ncbi:MAG TPA: hypothetical protein VHG92_03890 [Afifellaceae bacterium]|nr:hypothetical protein [Afifellaceae bacterium]
MPRREAGALLALLFGALALIAGSGYLAAELRQSHQPADLAYSEGPQVFRAWLSRTWRAVPDGQAMAGAVAKRLMSMPIAARRDTIAAMTDHAFWSGVAADEPARRALQAGMREAVLLGLHQAPVAGDLWLAAAALHTMLDGFDDRAAGYLAASYQFAPREGQVAYARAGLIAHVLPVLDRPLAEAAAGDLALIEATYPKLRRVLAEMRQEMETRR